MKAGCVGDSFVGSIRVASGLGLGLAGVGFLDNWCKNNNDGVPIDGVVEGFGCCFEIEDSTGHVWAEHDLVFVFV